MSRLPRIPSKLVIRALKRARFYEYHQVGSHVQFRHPIKTNLKLTIPFHRKELSPKTLKRIIKQADMMVEEFINFL